MVDKEINFFSNSPVQSRLVPNKVGNDHGHFSFRPQIAYDTRPYRKQQQQQNRLKPSMLPIGDPAVLWRHTVCLNAVIHRLRYTLTVAVCTRVPRKSSAVAVTDYYYQYDEEGDCRDGNVEGFDFDDGQDREYDLQLLSRHVHVSISATYVASIIFLSVHSVLEFQMDQKKKKN